VPRVPLADVAGFLDERLDVAGTPDYPDALNGLQVEAHGPVERVAVAVDASTRTILEAAAGDADLLVVHHGLFWGGVRPLTGYRHERIRTLVESGTALYSAHLPLDAHPEVGNAAVLARRLGLEELAPFGRWDGTTVGWKGAASPSDGELSARPRPAPGGSVVQPASVFSDELSARLASVVEGPVRVLPGGPGALAGTDRVAGAGASPPATADAALDDDDALAAGPTPAGRTSPPVPSPPALDSSGLAASQVGVVTGAGASFLEEAASAGLDALVTGEATHHHAVEAAELGVTVFLGGHYATETFGVKAVGDLLAERFGLRTWFVDAPTGL